MKLKYFHEFKLNNFKDIYNIIKTKFNKDIECVNYDLQTILVQNTISEQLVNEINEEFKLNISSFKLDNNLDEIKIIKDKNG